MYKILLENKITYITYMFQQNFKYVMYTENKNIYLTSIAKT